MATALLPFLNLRSEITIKAKFGMEGREKPVQKPV